MPSVSERQKRFMQAAAHNPKFAAKVGISQEVAKEFAKEDERKAKAQRSGKRMVEKRYTKTK